MSHEKTKMFSSPLKQSTKKGAAVERWEEELMRAFEGQIERKLVLEEEGITYVDSRNLTSEIKSTKKLTLRTAQQAANDDTIKLKQFDPNFMSPNEIRCRSPGCKQRRQRQSSFSKFNKEDLYLCPNHRRLVEDYVTKMCSEKGVNVGMRHSPGDFEGYTSVIGLLESAYFHFVKRPPGSENVLKGKPAILGEVFINLRNFLMITNALLNPDGGNVFTALKGTMQIFLEILEILREDGENIVECLTSLVGLLRSVIEHILFAFGIIYSWVYLALANNPGAQLGAGIGGFIGMVGLFTGGPVVGLLAMAGGSVFGGLTGSGLYNLQRQRREQQEVDDGLRRYQEFMRVHRIQEDQNEPDARVTVQAEDNQRECAQPAADDIIFYLTGSEEGDLILAFCALGGLMFGMYM